MQAFVFSCEHHADQRRRSGEEFIVHPVGVAKICAGMRLDTETLCAALLHDTVEDTSASLEEVREEFGDEIAGLVDGVTKLTGITFQSRDEAQAENYRKMMVAMATDIRVILIKLADRLHNMRTLEAMAKQKQIEKAKETLEIYAPLAHRLGIHAIKWELEDLAFATLHPRKYQEIKGLVSQQREEREHYVARAGGYLAKELEALGIHAEISGRAKHFYSIYSKMTRKGREFNEIYDLTAMRVIVDSVKDCYGAVGVIHSLWKPLPGRFKDMIAMPKFNMYQALHTTVIGPEGRPLEIQIRTGDMHETAEYGVAAHWRYKEGREGAARRDRPERRQAQVAQVAAGLAGRRGRPARVHRAAARRADRGRGLRLHAQGRGQVAGRRAPRRSTSPTRSTPTSATAAWAPRSTARSCRCTTSWARATSSRSSPPSASAARRGTGWRWSRRPARATRSAQWFKAESRDDSEHTGRELLQEHFTKAGLPAQRITGSPLLADVIREMGFRKADDFYIALGGAKISPKVVVNKVLQRLKQGESAEAEISAADDLLKPTVRRKPEAPSSKFGIRVEGVDDVPLRLAKCCRPVSGDPILGYVSLGRGITIHREDCPNAVALRKDPERFVPVSWDGDNETSLQGRDPGRRVGPPPPARGPLADVRRGRDQHRRGVLQRPAPDGQEPLRDRGGGHPGAEDRDQPPARDRLGVRRLPRHPQRRLTERDAPENVIFHYSFDRMISAPPVRESID